MSSLQRTTLDPDPPCQGETVRIRCEFDDPGASSVRLRVTFVPSSSDPTSYTVAPDLPVVTVEVPVNAEGMRVEDPDGVDPGRSVVVAAG